MKYIENSGKRLGSSHHLVPTSWKKGKTFLEDECLTFIFAVSAIAPSKKQSDESHSLMLAMCIVSGDVVESLFSCVVGKTGYCNHPLALMLKLCKFSLFDSKN